MAADSDNPEHFGAQELHDQIEKVSATLPDDVRRRVMQWVDEAGEVAGAMLMLDILYHLRIRDDSDLSSKARNAVYRKSTDG